ncbi:Mov34/MPN/PAD-1 family protein [Silvimonas sp.]|uniref:C40 family peptidase n=1 Tax=Silvimonas sp. TaxID=2650811 RepID=UPI00284C157C|nr:Mov34/MPN/PAD-1 family protein [Silvimonas sp.]MDR3427935.1 Mov34/MPN/PAD-1 family protein [Silvimonas sp.]
MKKTTLEAIKAHAIRDYPREACGLVVVIRGRERYVPCANTAPGTDHFRLAPEDYAAAEALGEITTVVHSHPDSNPEPSEADKVGCEASGLPWLIVGVARNGAGEPETTALASFAPSGYEAPLVGRSFHHGVLDCYSLIRDWYRRERGISLPDFERAGNPPGN